MINLLTARTRRAFRCTSDRAAPAVVALTVTLPQRVPVRQPAPDLSATLREVASEITDACTAARGTPLMPSGADR